MPTATLPVIDIAALASGDLAARRETAAHIGRAARDNGFFYVTGHGIPAPVIDRLLAQASALFALPTERKMSWYIGRSANHRGYVPPGEEVFAGGSTDRKEAFDLSADLPATDETRRRGGPMAGPNVWPDLDGFAHEISAYYAAASVVGRRLFGAFALALGLDEEFFSPYLSAPVSQLRLIHYPVAPEAVDAVGIGAHTDYECFTLLLPTAPGLEVMDRAGAWIDAPPVDGALVVNIGDLLEIWTNGEFVATSHRVRKVKEERYSFPLFCMCDHDTRVAPLDAFVTADRPARFRPLIAGAHLFAQTAQTFTYLRERLAAGTLTLPDGSLALSSFGQEHRHAAQPEER